MMSLRRFGLYSLAIALLVIASGLTYWLITRGGGEEEVVVKASITKVDKSASLMKASMENNTVFNSDYLGEVVTACCLITGIILYKLIKYRCKSSVESPNVPVVPNHPDVIPHAVIDMPHPPLPVQPYMYNYSAPPSYSSVAAPPTFAISAPSTVAAPPTLIVAPPTTSTEQVTVIPSTSTVKYKKNVTTIDSTSTESSDSETSDVIAAKAAADAAKKKRKRQRKKKENAPPTAADNPATTTT